MAFVKKVLILGISIPFFAIFVMSHNAGALNLNYDLNNYSLVNSGSLSMDCAFTFDTWTSSTRTCQINKNSSSNGNIFGFRGRTSFKLKRDDLVELYVTVSSNPNSDISRSYNYLYKYLPLYWTSSDFDVLSYEIVNDLSIVYQQLPNTDTFSCSDLNQNSFYCTSTHTSTWSNSFIFQVYRVILRAKNDDFYNITLNSTTSSRPLGQCVFDVVGSPYCDIYISGYSHYRFVGSEENREQSEATQNAIDHSEDEGDSSSSSAEGASASLLSAITGFFGVITSATPSNCVINAPLNTYFGNQRLNVDLCSLDLPDGIGALTSIIAIGIIIPFAIHMFKKFINLFRSFQS